MAAVTDEASVVVKSDSEPEAQDEFSTDKSGCVDGMGIHRCPSPSSPQAAPPASAAPAPVSDVSDRQTLLNYLTKRKLKDSADILLRESGLFDSEELSA